MNTSFGIGCFHFGLRRILPHALSFGDYFTELEATLKRITNVNEVHISLPGDVNETINLPPKLLPLNEGNQPVPSIPQAASIRFSVHIPYRLQSELYIRTHRKPQTFTERFEVHLHSTWEGLPIAFVEPVDPSEEPKPSEAVIVVRRFLFAQFTESLSPLLQFEILGPSPMHNEVYLLTASTDRPFEKNELFFAEYIPARGYDRVNVYYNPHLIESLDEARDMFFECALDELGLYYDMVLGRISQDRDWIGISDDIKQIGHHLNAQGMRGLFGRIFTVSRLINSVTTRIAEWQARNIELSASFRERYRSIYLGMPEVPIFQQRIDSELSQDDSYPVSALSEIVRFAEARRQGSLAVFINLIVGFLGAILGGAVAVLLGE